MSITQKQKDYHLRKMKTRITRLDINKDGYISREDYVLMGKQLAEYGKLTKEEANSMDMQMKRFADALNLQPGVRMPIDETAKKLSDKLLRATRASAPAEVRKPHNLLFDIIDTNKDGKISFDEFKAYFHIIAPALPENEVNHCFNTVDTNKDGIISREEFSTAAEDFMLNVEETETSKVFYGPLID